MYMTIVAALLDPTGEIAEEETCTGTPEEASARLAAFVRRNEAELNGIYTLDVQVDADPASATNISPDHEAASDPWRYLALITDNTGAPEDFIRFSTDEDPIPEAKRLAKEAGSELVDHFIYLRYYGD